MKIVLVETDARGGLIHFTYQLAEGLAATGADATILTGTDYELAGLPHRSRVAAVLRLWPQFDPPAETGLRRRARAALRPARRGWRAAVMVREWWRLTHAIEAEAPDVVLFSIIRFPFQLFFLRRLSRRGIRLAQICHEFEARELARNWTRRIHLRLTSEIYDCFAAIFFLSDDTRRAFLQAFAVPPERTHVLPHGPALIFHPEAAGRLPERHGLAPGERLVLMFGGLRPSKGVPDLVEAFAGAGARADARLVIAGYPSRSFDVAALERQVAGTGVADRIALDLRYLPMDELAALVGRADVVVFPYRNATASGALALAQSLARPIVATAVGGLAEAVEDGVTGRLVPPSDPAALGRAIGAMLDAPEAARRMGEAGRRVALGDRSWDAVARRMLEVLDGLPACRAARISSGGLRSPGRAPGRMRCAGPTRED